MGTWFDQVVRVASGLLTLATLALVIGLGIGFLSLRRMLRRLQADLEPLVKQSTAIADDVRGMTGTIKADVEKVSGTLLGATERVQQAVDLTEQRLNEFGALLAVLQKEAERVFVSSAAVIHGIRAGAAALAGRGGPELASDEVDTDADPYEFDDLEEPDGDDDFSEGTGDETDTPAQAPRIRPRSHKRRQH
jgi:hypothetical protein